VLRKRNQNGPTRVDLSRLAPGLLNLANVGFWLLAAGGTSDGSRTGCDGS
jgi:hypothetical protein